MTWFVGSLVIEMDGSDHKKLWIIELMGQIRSRGCA